MSEMCVTKEDAGKLLGVSKRMIEKYLSSGKLNVHHREKNRLVMIDVTEIYNFREKRLRGK
ncbi:MAG: hypothetical protein R3Y09_00110 [Clostridia bacterium]